VLGAGRLIAAALAAVLTCGVTAGCGDDPEQERDAADGGEAEATDETEPEDAGAAAVAAYEANWQNLLDAGDPPDPDAPALAEHASGDALDNFRTRLEAYAAEGIAFRGTYEHDAEAVEVTEERAVVEDCGLDQTELVVIATGEVAEDSDDERDGVVADLVLEDGAWKVTSLRENSEVCE
jgi:hypothetical protein